MYGLGDRNRLYRDWDSVRKAAYVGYRLFLLFSVFSYFPIGIFETGLFGNSLFIISADLNLRQYDR